jgi:hypothetical protein
VDQIENKYLKTTGAYDVKVIIGKAIIDQAKAMEKEQHGKTWDDCITQFIARGFNTQRTVCDFDEYYAGNYDY